MDNLAKLSDKLKQQVGANYFAPTDAHRKAKSAFWSHYFSSGELAPTQIDAAVAARLSGYSEVIDWFELKGFSEWFSNGEEFRQKVEYVSNLSLDVLQAVLLDVTAKTADRLNAAKMALEVAAKFPKSSAKESFADEKIAEMGRKELEELISSKLKHFTPAEK